MTARSTGPASVLSTAIVAGVLAFAIVGKMLAFLIVFAGCFVALAASVERARKSVCYQSKPTILRASTHAVSAQPVQAKPLRKDF
jgi:hypothetical protein